MPILPTAWTLSYEILFYIIVTPFAVGNKKAFYQLASLYVVLFILGRIFSTKNILIEFICSPLFIEFFYGFALAKVVDKSATRTGIAGIARTRTKRYLLFLLGLVLLSVAWIGTNLDITAIKETHRVIKYGIPFTLIIYGLLNVNESQRETSVFWKALSDSSYSLYLIQYPILLILNKVMSVLRIPSLPAFILCGLLCTLAGWISYKIIEKPVVSYFKTIFAKTEQIEQTNWRGRGAIYLVTAVFIILFLISYSIGSISNIHTIWMKKIRGAFIGDSITEQGFYLRALEDKYPIKAENYGIAGATYGNKKKYDATKSNIKADEQPSQPPQPLLCDLVKDVKREPDFIFILGGTNDWGDNVVLGKKGDKSRDTFYGGAYLLFEGLRKRFPKVPVFVSTIIQRNWTPSEQYPQPAGMDKNGNNQSIEDFNDAIVYMAHRYGCKVVDAYGESGITMDNIYEFTKDGVHLDARGGRRYADFIMSEMMPFIHNYNF